MKRRAVAAAAAACALHAVLGLAPAPAGAQNLDASAADYSTGVDYPVVITPTRLHQSLADVPASVTVISAETIRRWGIASIPEALRLVPGMAVLQANGNDWRINYHGGYAFTPRRLNVLIDGVSVYRPGLARVEWDALPVALEDVERIEVIRGPASSAYGPNSMTAVINILTRHAKDVERGLASVAAGSHGTVDTTLRLATTLGGTSLRATASTHRDSGYDQQPAIASGHDSTRLHRLNLRAQNELADGSALDLQLAYSGGRFQTTVSDPLRTTPDPYQRRAAMTLSGRWTKPLSATHELQVSAHAMHAAQRQSWRTCWPRVAFMPQLGALYAANPGYVASILAGSLPSGGTTQDDLLLGQLLAGVFSLGPGGAAAPVCGWANQDGDEARQQIEVQDTLVVSDSLRVVTGGGMRRQSIDSPTYVGPKAGNTMRWAFGHAEYRAAPWLTANLGGYFESNSLSGTSFSPRAALNLHLSDSQTLRLVLSKGTRSPDIYEEKGVWTYTLSGINPPIAGQRSALIQLGGSVGTGGLDSERIVSRELGWLLVRRDLGLTLDARLFDDRLSHLTPSLPLSKLYSGGHVRLSGAELQGSWELPGGWSAMLGYAYLLNREAPDLAETMQYSRHSGSLGISRALPDDWRVSLAWYGASGDGYEESRYGRTDLAVTHGFRLGALPASAGVVLGYLDTPTATTAESSFPAGLGPVRAAYDSRFSIRGSLRLTF